MELEKRTYVGIGVMIFKDGKVLMGKRKGSFASGEYAFTGGYLEYMESFEDCARRETREEAGIEIKNIRFLFLGNLRYDPPKHFIQISVIADWEEGEPRVMEPNKCDGWDWYDLDNLPTPIFMPTQLMIEAYKTGVNFKDVE